MTLEWTPPLRPDPFPAPPPPQPYNVHLTRDPVAERLFEQRLVLAHGELTTERLTQWCAALLTLDGAGDQPIKLHLSVPDAEPGAALTLLDTIESLRAEVHVMVTGQLGGPALVVLAGAASRRASPNALFRLGEPRFTAEGHAEQILAQQEQHRRVLDTVYRRLAELTRRPVEEVREDARRNRHLDADEAMAYGLVGPL
ncbi:ATP-dependent Clp protease proteolytic subunit [Nonomuraea sp. NPDC050310]|uniref:ClpP family protease n=1 Tax=unclassified Nonomuraea TaxID=2593643 RepID=UPI0033E296BD